MPKKEPRVHEPSAAEFEAFAREVLARLPEPFRTHLDDVVLRIAEFASASIHLSNAIKDLYSIYESERGKNPGKLPVIACTSSQAMKDRYGTNYRPVFNLASWVDRPTEMPNESPVSPADIWQGSASSAPRSSAPVHVPPPVAKAETRQADPLAEPVF